MSKVEYDREKATRYEHTGRTSEMGRSNMQVTCPFCQTEFKAYVWSLCGGGKKCPECGAMHTSSGSAYPVKP